MNWKMMEESVDTALMGQMSAMIYSLSEKKEKDVLYGNIKRQSIFGNYLLVETQNRLEDQYGLRYPGEVLERYQEKIGDLPVILRTLAVTMTLMRELTDPSMFIGNQLGDFLKKIEREKEDLYLTGMADAFEESADKKLKSHIWIQNYNGKDLIEWFYRLELLGYGAASGNLAELIYFIGEGRDFLVYENAGLYGFLAGYFSPMEKQLPKEAKLIKAICRLPAVNVDTKTPVRRWLLDSGYSEDETRFLNASLIFSSGLPYRILERSITAERIAVNYCRHFLGAKEVQPQPVYDLCRHLLQFYHKYSISLEGKKGIIQTLEDKVKPQNMDAFMIFYENEEAREKAKEFFYVNLTEDVWKSLSEKIGTEAYRKLFCDVVLRRCFPENDLSSYLDLYQEVTGEEFSQNFWKKDGYTYSMMFSLLAKEGKIDPCTLAEEFFSDSEKLPDEKCKEKWQFMLRNMEKYAFRLNTHESVEIFRKAEEHFDVTDLGDKIYNTELLNGCFGMMGYSDNLDGLTISREDFSIEENRKIFTWAEKYVYRKRPALYRKFMLKILSSEEAALLDEETAAACAKMLIADPKVSEYEKQELRKKYYCASEMEEYQKEQEAKREMEEQAIMQRIRKDAEDKFEQMVSKLKGAPVSWGTLRDFIYRQSGRGEDVAMQLVNDYLKKQYSMCGAIRLAKHEITDFFALLARLYRNEVMTAEDVKNYVNKMEAEKV